LKHDASPDLNGNTLQRRKALWALMNMGENLKTFATIPAEQQQNLLAGLKEEANADGARAGWARTALWYLDKGALPGGKLQGVVKVDEVLVVTAEAEDQFLRQLTAMAFNFWDGEQAEATLLKLSRDTGRGSLLRVEEND
jgi:predicted AAA+ superfamily ATPase